MMRPLRTAAFSTGAAWMSLALQGTQQGLVVHAMEGFDYDKAHEVVHAPANTAVQCMIAIGLPGDISVLPEGARPGETPNDREPIEKHIVEGSF